MRSGGCSRRLLASSLFVSVRERIPRLEHSNRLLTKTINSPLFLLQPLKKTVPLLNLDGDFPLSSFVFHPSKKIGALTDIFRFFERKGLALFTFLSLFRCHFEGVRGEKRCINKRRVSAVDTKKREGDRNGNGGRRNPLSLSLSLSLSLFLPLSSLLIYFTLPPRLRPPPPPRAPVLGTVSS